MEEKKSGVKKFSKMSDNEILLIEELDEKLPEVPGLPKDITICSICGEHVMDGKEVKINNEIVCKSCANKNH